MTTMKKTICMLMLAAILLCLTACGEPKVEITDVQMSESKVLNIQYTAHSDVPKGDASIKITVSADNDNVSGTVYCMMGVEEDLKKDGRHIGLFDMAGKRAWTVDGSLKFGGSTVQNTVETADILSQFGDDAEVTASFIIGDETVSEKALSDK